MWNPECTNLLPALVMVSPAKPGTFLENLVWVSVPGTSCVSTARPRFGPVGFSGKEHTPASQAP